MISHLWIRAVMLVFNSRGLLPAFSGNLLTIGCSTTEKTLRHKKMKGVYFCICKKAKKPASTRRTNMRAPIWTVVHWPYFVIRAQKLNLQIWRAESMRSQLVGLVDAEAGTRSFRLHIEVIPTKRKHTCRSHINPFIKGEGVNGCKIKIAREFRGWFLVNYTQ